LNNIYVQSTTKMNPTFGFLRSSNTNNYHYYDIFDSCKCTRSSNESAGVALENMPLNKSR